MTGETPGVRERILNAATELMRTHGLRKVTMEEIARAVGISKKTLYQAYSGKAELVRAMAEREFALWEAKGRELVEQHADVVDQMHALARHAVEAHRYFGPEMRRDLRVDYPDVWEALRGWRRRHDAALVRLIERGIAAGKFKRVDPAMAAMALRAALARVTEADTVQEHSFTADEAARDVYELFLHGLTVEPATAALETAS